MKVQVIDQKFSASDTTISLKMQDGKEEYHYQIKLDNKNGIKSIGGGHRSIYSLPDGPMLYTHLKYIEAHLDDLRVVNNRMIEARRALEKLGEVV